MLAENDAKQVREFGEDLKGFVDELIEAIINEDVDAIQSCIDALNNAFTNLGMDEDSTFGDTFGYLNDMTNELRELKEGEDEG